MRNQRWRGKAFIPNHSEKTECDYREIGALSLFQKTGSGRAMKPVRKPMSYAAAIKLDRFSESSRDIIGIIR